MSFILIVRFQQLAAKTHSAVSQSSVLAIFILGMNARKPVGIYAKNSCFNLLFYLHKICSTKICVICVI